MSDHSAQNISRKARRQCSLCAVNISILKGSHPPMPAECPQGTRKRKNRRPMQISEAKLGSDYGSGDGHGTASRLDVDGMDFERVRSVLLSGLMQATLMQ